MMARVTRLASQHLAICRGHRVLAIFCTRDQARRAQKRYNRRYSTPLAERF